MAIHCPAYDPFIGWHILVFGPTRPMTQSIISPLHYYYTMEVTPLVNASFSNDDYEDLEIELEIDEEENYFDHQGSILAIGLHNNSALTPVIPEIGLPFLPKAAEVGDSKIDQGNNNFDDQGPLDKDIGLYNNSAMIPVVSELGLPSLSKISSSLHIPKLFNYPPQYVPITSELGDPKSSLQVKTSEQWLSTICTNYTRK